MRLPVVDGPMISIPTLFPEMTCDPLASPAMTAPAAESMSTPWKAFPRSASPEPSVPIRLPITVARVAADAFPASAPAAGPAPGDVPGAPVLAGAAPRGGAPAAEFGRDEVPRPGRADPVARRFDQDARGPVGGVPVAPFVGRSDHAD